jgi:hypothetical protein
MEENLTPDEIRARDEWRAEILKSDWFQAVIRTAVKEALDGVIGACRVAMNDVEDPDYIAQLKPE